MHSERCWAERRTQSRTTTVQLGGQHKSDWPPVL